VAFDNHQYVPDRLVIETLKKKVDEFEKHNKDYIIEGFPRTKVQALALNELGIIPDKIILLRAPEQAQKLRLKYNLLDYNPDLGLEKIPDIVKRQMQEHNLNIKGVIE
jgi:adenylate kinase